MTKEELQKQKEVQQACKEGLKAAGSAAGNQLKDDIHKDGIIGTLLKGAVYVGLKLLTGK